MREVNIDITDRTHLNTAYERFKWINIILT